MRIKLIYLFSILLSLSACSQISYYSQSINGQWQVSRLQKPINELLEEDSLSPELQRRLKLVQSARQFATDFLLLPDNNSYTDYADLQRDYIVWNIVYTKALSVRPERSCFFIVGCLDYRGYFKHATALQKAQELKAQGFDVQLGGVAAYSTLGWFDDPVLNTMLHWEDTKLISIIFHELAHQKLYVNNDTEFNEAFADAIALIGLREWLKNQNNLQALHEYQTRQTIHEAFIDLLLNYRTQLELLYGSKLSDKDKLKRKQIIFNGLKAAYESQKREWQSDRYDDWFYQDLNNAKLAAVASYRRLLPAFMAMFAEQQDSLIEFYAKVAELGELSREQRHKTLETYLDKADKKRD